MRWVSRAVTIAVAAVLIGAVVLVAFRSVRDSEPSYRFHTSAAFRDASLLPVGSRVMVAGVQVGRITSLTVDGRVARVAMGVRDDLALYDDAWAEKKMDSLFGDGYVEIHPGTPEGHRRLEDGEPIPRVHEGASADRTLRAVDQGLPRAKQALDDATRFAQEARRTVDGPLADRLAAIDRAVQDPDLVAPLERANDALGRFEAATDDAADAVARARPQVAPTLDRWNARIEGVTADLKDGQAALQDNLGNARARIDEVDPYIEDAVEVMARLDGQAPPEDQGTLGRMINDPTLGDQIADVAEAGADATGGLTRMESYVGLRYEFNVLARQSHVALGVEIAGGHDSFYLLEAEKNEGMFPDVEVSDQLVDDHWVRVARISEDLRLTLQWGHRFDRVALRFGLRENEFAAGADVQLMSDRLQLRSDVFLPSYQRVPRLKLALAMRVIESAYVLAGVDDALRAGVDIPIQPWPADQDVPTALDHVHDGRDYFVGGYLRFSDRDLDTLLLLYGATIFAAL